MIYAICGAAVGLTGGIFIMTILAVIQARTTARRYRERIKAEGMEPRKRKIEFSKILAAWAVFIATAIIVASVTLAAFDKQPLSDLAIAVFTACIGYLITYAGKSAFEKSSRNKHGLDADGQPFDQRE